MTLLSAVEVCHHVKRHFRYEAQRNRSSFEKLGLTILLTHVLATACATIALALHGAHAPRSRFLLPVFLMLELLLLGLAYRAHHHLHHSTEGSSARMWARHRLTAEINRSVEALGNLHPAYHTCST